MPTLEITTEAIADALGLKRRGERWRGPCPLHGGSSFTMDTRAGKPVFYCWAGCDRGELLSELKRRGLWPEPEPLSPDERRVWAARRRRAEALADEAEAWRAAYVDELEILAASGGYGTAPEIHSMRTMRGAALAEAYLTARDKRPDETAALVAARQQDEQIARNILTWFIRKIAGNTGPNSNGIIKN